MTAPGDDLLGDTAEELFEEAPCGYLTTRLDGTILKVNRTFEQFTGHERADLVGRRRLQDLLTVGGRIYHETHFAPLLRMQGFVREIALDVVRADGAKLPVLVSSVLRHDADGRPRVVRTTIFDASDRRRYERELVRAREREHDIALELQRSLLSGALPEVDGLRIDVEYRPAVRGLEVGGDWYDAFAVEGASTVALAVGDVVGRGIGAAAVMGQLRSAARALASTGRSPSAVLDGLEGYARRHEVGQMTTLAYSQIDVPAGELVYACAGHPPPAVVEPDGSARFLDGARSLPLDAFGSRPRDEARERLAPGSRVVLYTDGLVERRNRSLNAGLARLLDVLGTTARESPAAFADAVASSMVGRAERDDDVCVLVAHLTGGGAGAPGRA